MKKILITQRLCRHEAYDEIYDRLDTQWARLLEKAGIAPVLLPSGYNTKLFLQENLIEGMLLTGGNNLSCVEEDELSIQRDAMEKDVLDFALDADIPILGVCRGMQLIAHYFGASLVPVTDHAAVRHDCTVFEASRFRDYFSQCREVNSYHDYAVTALKEPLIVSAVSRDGSIEAIEHESKKVLGFMWHPERETPFLKIDINFFHTFYTYY